MRQRRTQLSGRSEPQTQLKAERTPHAGTTVSEGGSIPWLLFSTTLVGDSVSPGDEVLKVVATWYVLYWTPNPLPESAPRGVFAEDRALKHVRVLSEEIGFRQVATPGLVQAGSYLEAECRRLAELANRRGDLDAQVDVETVSGAIVDRIFKIDLINIYRHLTNIVLFVGPKDALEKPAVLINAHYDSALGSPGAADCGSCVGVGLEVVRALIECGQSLPRPVILLLNGGEETLLQAAHGFMQQSSWRHRVGTFINLESTGSGGGPILFQYTGTWTLRAYAAGAHFPRAIVLAQEFFESGVIPADTDFRMFSKEHHGAYPGVDLATVLDATPYHTDRDTFERLRPGTTQEYGEMVLALTEKLMEMLDTHTNDTSSEKLVYSDAGHLFLMLYSIETAKWLHATPFALLLVSLAMVGEKGTFLRATAGGVVQNLASVVLAILVPMVFGLLRAAFTGLGRLGCLLGEAVVIGRPMVWFSHHIAAFAFFWPAALLGFVLPMNPGGSQAVVSAKFAAISLTTGGLAWGLTHAEIGSSIIPFIIALSTAFISCTIASTQTLPFRAVLGLSLISAVFCAPLLLVMVKHVMEKIGMAGGGRSALGYLLPDTVAGALNGFFAMSVLQSFAPLITVHWTPYAKKRLLQRLLWVCFVAGLASSWLFPYSLRHPKRLFFNHLCRQQADYSCESVWSVASWDAIGVEQSLPEALKQRPRISATQIDWIALAPFNRIVADQAFTAPPLGESGPWGSTHPRLELINQTVSLEQSRRRLEFELKWEKPGWGAMNISGPILDWSLSDPIGIKNGDNAVRFSQDAVDPVWPFWIDVEADAVLQLQLGIYYPLPTDLAQELIPQFPEWTSVIAGASFVCQWAFPPL